MSSSSHSYSGTTAKKEIDHGTVLFTCPDLKPDMSDEACTNAVRPDQRFTPGARRWVSGLPGDVPLGKKIDHGTVLFTCPDLKPDMSSEARTNAVRPDQRFTPGARRWLGGLPHDAPLGKKIDHGTVLFTCPDLKPDMSGEARTNAVGPDQRFTPGARRWASGLPRDAPLEEEVDHGTVLFTYPDLKPDMSDEARTNAVRPDQSFTPGARRWVSGLPRDAPLEEEFDHGTVLFTYPDLKPDMSDEAHTNAVRPDQRFTPGARRWLSDRSDQRLGTTGHFVTSVRHFLEGEPRDVASCVGGVSGDDDTDGNEGYILAAGMDLEDEEEVGEGAMPMNALPSVDAAMFNNFQQQQVAVGGVGNDGVFRRCGSDSKFPAAGADLMSGNFPAF